ncbi:hypothetical protein Taro_024799 [Colocasia esculenta]|uniref:H(+)/Pi cotransporter n=1 Tax=Colocasia esculenta TaxID=4460 RepID=A0A843VCC7_COLES|nr:hypothetical protein [Colocasia esculenta]
MHSLGCRSITVGFLFIPLVTYPTRTSWRNMYRVLSILPLAYSFLVLPFVSESPRWLIIRGRTKEAMDILNKLARINGRRLPVDLTISNPVPPTSTGGGRGKKNESLWSTRWAVKRMVLTMATEFGVGFIYYGVQLNVENLNFNPYLSEAVNSLMEISAVILGSVLLSFMGRHTLFSSSAALACAACLLCIPFAGRRKGSKGS